jgi:hypothetical protein
MSVALDLCLCVLALSASWLCLALASGAATLARVIIHVDVVPPDPAEAPPDEPWRESLRD